MDIQTTTLSAGYLGNALAWYGGRSSSAARGGFAVGVGDSPPVAPFFSFRAPHSLFCRDPRRLACFLVSTGSAGGTVPRPPPRGAPVSSEAVRAAGSLAEVNCRPRRDSQMSAFLGTAAAPGRARSDLQAHCLASRCRGRAACVAILPPEHVQFQNVWWNGKLRSSHTGECLLPFPWASFAQRGVDGVSAALLPPLSRFCWLL